MMLPISKGYTAVDTDSEKGEFDSFLDGSSIPHIKKSRWPWHALLNCAPWILSVILSILSTFLLIERHSQPHGTYERGFTSDLITDTTIPLEQIRFRRSPHFLANGSGWLDPVDKMAPWPENMVLFGSPNPEIDRNWDRLIGARYFSISEEDAVRIWGDNRHQYIDERQGGYTAGLDLFHTLHCVNALRKGLHPEYYGHHSSHGPFHLEHCLDAIRQSIQCYGSTTLIPTRFREGLHHNYIDSDQVHTCRSFTFLRDFVDSRASSGDAYVHRDITLVDQRKNGIAAAWFINKKKGKGKKGNHGNNHDHGN